MPRPKPVILFMDLPRASVLFLIFQYSTVGLKIKRFICSNLYLPSRYIVRSFISLLIQICIIFLLYIALSETSSLTMTLFSYILGVIPLIQNLPISTSTRLVYTNIGIVFKIYPLPNK